MAHITGTARGSINTLRRVIKEMRQTLPKEKPVSDQPLTKYILNEYRRHQVTSTGIDWAAHKNRWRNC